MATIAELNIRLGLLSKDFERSLASFEKRVQTAATRMGDAGESMSLAFTLPLLGLGAIAIKTAGEFEALRLGMTTTMESVGRGAVEATKEVSELQKIALAPGIDFEQAVKGSLRLQGVGLSAEKARLVIKELGNQIASSGGSAEQLDAVTKQFTQIIGKGRILQEDLSIILENMPSLARVLKDEFGTTSADALRELGVSAEDFIERLTNRMATVPRAAGGIANSITNATVAIRTAFAKVGETIDKVFNVSGALDAFAAWVVDLADKFAGLDTGTKKAVIGIALFVAALGPAIKLMSVITSGAISLVGTFARVAESFRITAAAGTGTIGIFSRLSTAMKISLFVGVAGAVLALGAAFAALALSSDEASESQQVFADAQKTVTEEVGRETAVLNKNFEVLKSTTATTEERTAAIKELQATYPNYLRNVNLEGASLTALTEIQGQLNSQILKGVAERQKAIAIEGQYNKAAQAQLRITQLRQQGFAALSGEEVKAAGRSLFGTELEKSFVSASAQGRVVSDVIKQLEADVKGSTKAASELAQQFDTAFGIGEKASNKSTDAVVNQRTAMEAAKDAIEDMTPAQRTALEFSKKWDERWAAMQKSGKNAFGPASNSAKLYQDALASIAAVAQKSDVLGSDVMTEQAREIGSQIERLLENGFKPYSKEIGHLRQLMVDLHTEAGKGFFTPNATQTAIAELNKVNDLVNNIIGLTPVNLVSSVPGFNFDSPTIPAIEVPVKVGSIEGPKIDLPLLEIPKAIVSIDATEAINSITALKDAVAGYVGGTSEFQTTTNAQREIFANLANDTITATEAFNQFGEIIRQRSAGTAEMMQIGADAVTSFGESIAAMIESSDSSFQGFVGTVLRGAAEIVGALIRIFVAKMMANTAFFAANPIVAAALAGTIAAIATAVFKKGISAAKLAKGGVVDRPTLALVGEYAGASNNPEIITPENKLTNVFTDVLNSFDFPVPEIPEQKTIKQEPLPAPVVNIRLGNVAPTSSDTPPVKGNVFSAISKNVLDAVNNTDSTNTTFKILEQGFKSVSNEFSEIFESSDIRRVEREQTTVGGEFQYVENNTTSTFRLLERGFESIANEFSQTFERLDVRNVEGAEKTTTGGEFQYVEKNTASTFKEVLSGFKIPEINIFQSGEPAPADQPGRGISRTFRSIAQSVVMPEMQSIQAPAVNVTNRDVFTGIAPVKIESEEDSQLTAVVRGDDLLFLVDKAAVRRGRTK